MADTLVKDAQYLSGKVYNNGKFPKNLGYKSIETQNDSSNGFYAEAFFKNGKIIIAYRGSDFENKNKNKEKEKDIKNNIAMLTKNIPSQAKNARLFYDYIERKYPYTIYATGHSLGGSLAQMVSSNVKELKAITFNAYGTGQIKGINAKYPENVTNYGHANDLVFSKNIDKHVGKVFISGENTSDRRHLQKYHSIENMGDIDKAKEYKPQDSKNKSQNNPINNKINTVHEKIQEYDKKLKKKKSEKNQTKSKAKASAGGRWVTVNGRHLLITD